MVLLFAALSLTLVPSAVQAHKLKVFAFVDGTTIRGLVFFGREAPAKGVNVTASAPDGTVLAKTLTDAEGRFSVDPARRIDHRIVADAGDGHAAEFVITAVELQPALPGGDAGAPPVTTGDPATTVALPSAMEGGTPQAPVASAPSAAGGDAAALATLVDAAVARQLGPLREQLAQFEEQVLLRDVLGGLGYIVGMTGLALWLRARTAGRPR